MGITSRDGAAPKRAAIVLSGCGVYDGTEITEAVCAVLAAERAGAVPVFFAPDTAQTETVDHSTGKTAPEKRGVLAESARIARGNIAPLSEFRPENFDALIIPGGKEPFHLRVGRRRMLRAGRRRKGGAWNV